MKNEKMKEYINDYIFNHPYKKLYGYNSLVSQFNKDNIRDIMRLMKGVFLVFERREGEECSFEDEQSILYEIVRELKIYFVDMLKRESELINDSTSEEAIYAIANSINVISEEIKYVKKYASDRVYRNYHKNNDKKSNKEYID